MDKYELEQFEQIKELTANLQACFIDEDSYSKTPNAHEWRQAGRIVRQIVLACYELTGYSKAKRCIELQFVRESLHVTQNETAPPAEQPTAYVLKETPGVGTSGEEEQGFVEFTEQEIQQMPKKIQNLIIVNRKRCRIRKHACGKNSTTYEIRFRCDDYNITACGKTIKLAKANFREKLKTAKPQKAKDPTSFPTTFTSFTRYYFEKFRKPKLDAETYAKAQNRLEKHLFPYFKETELARITPTDCQNFLDYYQEKGMGRTVEELYSQLSIIFKGAIAHGIVERNPLQIVVHVKHERKSGCALTREEEKALLESIKKSKYEIAYVVALFTGLRPNELSKARIEGDFVVTINSKRKSRKIEYKKIPICEKLKPYVARFDELKDLKQANVSVMFPTYCAGHKLYDLRTTFNTRCKELGVSDHARMHFMGHSLGALGNAYTDLSDEYLLKEGKKLNFW